MIKDYFRDTFPTHLEQLDRRHPFFLGNSRNTEETSSPWSWDDVIEEMKRIAGKQCPDFVCCLYFVLISEQMMLQFLDHIEPDDREPIMYPELGLSGRLGEDVRPILLLSRAEALRVFDGLYFHRSMEDFFNFMIEETEAWFERRFPRLDPLAYFEMLRREPSLPCDEGALAKAFRDALADVEGTGASRRPQSVYVYFFSEGAVRLGPFQSVEWTLDGRLVDQNKTEIARFNPPGYGWRTFEILYDSQYWNYQINGIAISTDPHRYGVRDHQGRRLRAMHGAEDFYWNRRRRRRQQAFQAAEADRTEKARMAEAQQNLFPGNEPAEDSNDG
jgi:hypothetical protein